MELVVSNIDKFAQTVTSSNLHTAFEILTVKFAILST